MGIELMAVAALLAASAPIDVAAPSSPVTADGLARIPALIVPPSTYLSPEAKLAYIDETRHPLALDPIQAAQYAPMLRRQYDAVLKPQVERTRALYPVDIQKTEIGGVPVEIVTPKGGVAKENQDKVLINLHGGAFMVGGGGPGGELESAPVSSLGGYKVVAVDYRLAPEHRFPSASQDVEAVYRELLKRYRPQRIGLYGCSSGGTLAAQAVVWLAAHGLPRPGAIGVLCASLSPNFGGDSAYLAPPLNGIPPVALPEPGGRWKGTGETPYMEAVDLTSPLAQPLGHAEVMAKFPPTLFITSTRAPEMSAAVYSHEELIKYGVDADLHVFEGLWHGFAGDVRLPESREFSQVIVRFFDRELK